MAAAKAAQELARPAFQALARAVSALLGLTFSEAWARRFSDATEARAVLQAQGLAERDSSNTMPLGLILRQEKGRIIATISGASHELKNYYIPVDSPAGQALRARASVASKRCLENDGPAILARALESRGILEALQLLSEEITDRRRNRQEARAAQEETLSIAAGRAVGGEEIGAAMAYGDAIKAGPLRLSTVTRGAIVSASLADMPALKVAAARAILESPSASDPYRAQVLADMLAEAGFSAEASAFQSLAAANQTTAQETR